MENAGKMPALQRGIGLNAVRESGSAGVSPAKTGSAGVPLAMTNAGKMPALRHRNGPGYYIVALPTRRRHKIALQPLLAGPPSQEDWLAIQLPI